MYNEIIAKRLSNLRYLSPMKKSNVTILSKKNDYSDVLKFFAQINTDNIIQKISFKASGCSTFLSMCDYFCEMVEGKTIEQALKISEDDLKAITTLDKSREHVYLIILDTFKLLLKKYNKGIEKNKIKPIEKTIEVDTKDSQITKKEEKVASISEIDDVIIENIKPSKNSNQGKSSKNSNSRTKITKKSQDVEESKIIIAPDVVIEEDNNIMNNSDNLHDSHEQIIAVKEEIRIVETVKEDGKEKTTIEEKKTSHLMALRQKISNKENNEKAHNHASSLNSMLALMNQHKKDTDNVNNSKSTNINISNEKEEQKKEKKSLFSWLKKK